MDEQIIPNTPNGPEQTPIVVTPPVPENPPARPPLSPTSNPLPSESKPKSKKKLVTIIALLIIVLIAAVIVYKQFHNNYIKNLDPGMALPSASPFPIATADMTSKWETFSGIDYSFKYPKSFEAPVESTEGDWKGASLVMFGETQKASGRTQTELFDGLAVKTLTNKSEYTSAKDAAEEYHMSDQNSSESISGSVSEVQEITVGGKTAYYYEVHGYGDARVYFIDLGGSVLRATILYAGAEEDVKNYLSLADQILSTFEFTGAQTYEWVYYSDQDLGLSFNYPTLYEPVSRTETEAKLNADYELLLIIPETDQVLVSVYSYNSDLPLNQWWSSKGVLEYKDLVEKHGGTFDNSLTKTASTKVGGVEAIEIHGSVESALRGDSDIFVTKYNGKMIMFEYHSDSVNAQKLVDSVIFAK